MKHIKFKAVLLVIMLFLSGCGTKINEKLDMNAVITASKMDNDVSSSEYMLITQNDLLSFWFDINTTAFKIVDKANGFEWHSLGDNNAASSLFEVSYVNESGLIEKMDAMEASIAKGQYSYERTDNGIKVTYSLGEYDTEIKVPFAITEERMKELLSNIEDDFSKSQFETMYQYVNFERLDKENQKLFLEQYPAIDKIPLYVIREGITQSDSKKKKLSEILISADYTEEMYEEDSQYFLADDVEKKIYPQFRIQIVYELDDNGITVTIPHNEIQMNPEFPLLEIKTLKYFGAPSNNDIGYFLLPDGSGSLMNFYNGTGHLQEYSAQIYGLDYSAALTENTFNAAQAYLPVYGIVNGMNAMFCVIENGDAVATINAYPGNEQLSAFVSPTFKLRNYYKSYMNSNTKVSDYFVSMQNERLSEDLVMRYIFSNGPSANYSGMADWYRKYLFGDEIKELDCSVEAVVECIGQIDKHTKAFGFSFNKEIPLTTFSDVKDISEQLNDSGVNFSVRYSGWYGGGYLGRYAEVMDINNELGDAKDFAELVNYFEENEISFYPDAEMQYTYRTGLFDGFSPTTDSVKLISKSKGYKIEFNPATFARDPEYITPAYINKPLAIQRAFEGFFEKYKGFKLKTISLRNIGRNLDGDYADDGTDRQAAANMLLSSVKNIKNDYKIMTNGANAFMLNYVDYCCDLPLKSNGYDNTDESIPFLQMVLSGNVSYSGPALNLSGDPKNIILQMASVAADPYYIVSAKNSNGLLDRDYAFLYSTYFNYLKDEIIGLVGKYSVDMNGITGQKIIDYIKVADRLYKTVFADGATVTVNYSDRDITIDGITYKAESYVVHKGG